MLKSRGWRTELMHGNMYQKGIPDLYVMHPDHGTRWIDAKVAGKYSFTKDQKKTWPAWHFKYNVGIWILTGGGQDQYDLLFGPPNWLDFWKKAWGDPKRLAEGPDIDRIIEPLLDERVE